MLRGKMNRIFIGYDERQAVSYTALQQSIISLSKKPVAITPLRISQLPIERQGLTPFTFTRFLVPWLCDYKGWGLFLDVDIILNHDISELFDLADESKAILVSKNEHRFEWASVMLFNCGHEANKILTPEYVEKASGLHTIKWCDENLIGDLPREWNHLVGYDQPRNDPKLIHYTQGVPAYPETVNCEHADKWLKYAHDSTQTLSWNALMGNSIHAACVDGKNLPKFLFDLERGMPKVQYAGVVEKLLHGSV